MNIDWQEVLFFAIIGIAVALIVYVVLGLVFIGTAHGTNATRVNQTECLLVDATQRMYDANDNCYILQAFHFKMTPELQIEEATVKMCIIFNLTDPTCDNLYGGIGPKH